MGRLSDAREFRSAARAAGVWEVLSARELQEVSLLWRGPGKASGLTAERFIRIALLPAAAHQVEVPVRERWTFTWVFPHGSPFVDGPAISLSGAPPAFPQDEFDGAREEAAAIVRKRGGEVWF